MSATIEFYVKRRHRLSTPMHSALMAGMYLADRQHAMSSARLADQELLKRHHVTCARAANRRYIQYLRYTK
jgi:hypothetical protein